MARGALVLPLVALALARMLIKREWIWGVAALVLAAAALLTNQSLPVKLYPAVVSLSFLAVFGYSLVKPPSSSNASRGCASRICRPRRCCIRDA